MNGFRAELEARVVRCLSGMWSARMLSQTEKVELALELTDRLCRGPGWPTQEALSPKVALRLVSPPKSNPPGACV